MSLSQARAQTRGVNAGMTRMAATISGCERVKAADRWSRGYSRSSLLQGRG